MFPRLSIAVSRLCSVLNVTRQGYWAWKQRPVSRRRLEDERLKPLILKAWEASDQTYGAPRRRPSCASPTAATSLRSGSRD